MAVTVPSSATVIPSTASLEIKSGISFFETEKPDPSVSFFVTEKPDPTVSIQWLQKYLQKYFNNGEYIFLECGKENGQEAIEGLPYKHIACFGEMETEDDFGNPIDVPPKDYGYREFLDEIIYERNDFWKDLRYIIVDGWKELLNLAEPYVVDMHNKENPDKQVTSINGALGGFGKGADMCDNLAFGWLVELQEKTGIRFCIIDHVKQKEKTDDSGELYDILTASMGDKHFNYIKTKVPFCGICYIDREIIRENKKLKAKNGKEKVISKGIVKSETRYIKFRDDNYSTDGKSRFAEVTNEPVAFNEDSLHEALCEAIKKEQAKSGVSFEEAVKQQEKERLQREKIIEEKLDKEKEQKEINDTIEEIKSIAMENVSDPTWLAKFKLIIPALSKVHFDTVEEARATLNQVKDL